MDIKDYTIANKEAWEQVASYHRSASADRLDKDFSKKGFIIQDDPDLLRILRELPLIGKDVIHVCCNNGSELMSLKNMGAMRCVGVDISGAAVMEASERSRICGIECEFFESDVYDMPRELNGSFDLVHISSGCIGWMPDLDRFFGICAGLLRPEGCFLIHEIHPFSEILPFDGDESSYPLKIVEPYFRDGPIVDNESLDYLGGAEYDAKTQYWFTHTMSDLIMALSGNGFVLKEFHESPKDISSVHKNVERAKACVPLSLIILAKKGTA